MKKYILLLVVLIAISSLLFIGCSDDDEDSVVAAAVAQGFILAQVNINPEIDFDADIMKITNNTGVILDSAKAGDSLCEVDLDSYWYVYGDQNFYDTDYYSADDTMSYVSGDMFTSVYYFSNGIASGSVKLLHEYDDAPSILLPADEDTLSLGTPINAVWSSVPNADWYGVYIRYYKDSSGTYSSGERRYSSTTDTTYSIPGANTMYDGYYRIYIQAVSGPLPSDPPNITGAGWTGDFVSESSTNDIQIFMGTGDPTPVSDQDVDDIEDPTSISIVRNIFDLKNEKPVQNQNQ